MIDWAKTAFLFPGQGSQEVGMGAALAEAYPAARAVFEEADDILGFALSTLCWHGPEAALNDTVNTQPALYVAGIAALRALHAEFGGALPGVFAGHSLGEFTALTAAGSLDFADGLRLVRQRGELMQQMGRENPGGMAAILGLGIPEIEAICAQATSQTGGALVVANDNCPGQVVISGDAAAVEAGMQLASEAGAKRALKLAVSIAAHSPLMANAVAPFTQALAAAAFKPPRAPVISNAAAAPTPADPAAIRQQLVGQLTSTVRWTESITAMQAMGITRYVELGPKDVLVGLVKRIDRKSTRIALNSPESMAQLGG